jgi:hypothetical protein
VESMPVLFGLWSEVSDCNHSATPPLPICITKNYIIVKIAKNIYSPMPCHIKSILVYSQSTYFSDFEFFQCFIC